MVPSIDTIDTGASERSIRYTKLLDFFKKFLHLALLPPSQQRFQEDFNGLHTALQPGLMQLLQSISEKICTFSREEIDAICAQHGLLDKLTQIDQVSIQNTSKVLTNEDLPAAPALELAARMAAKHAEEQLLLATLKQEQEALQQLQAEQAHKEALAEALKGKFSSTAQQLLPLEEAMQQLLQAAEAAARAAGGAEGELVAMET